MDLLKMKTGYKDKTVIVQGFGKVGSWGAKFVVEAGAKMIGVEEVDASLINPEGIDPNVDNFHLLYQYKKVIFSFVV